MMDIASNNGDTTTTDYDSGDSDGVSYAYEGGKGMVCLKQPLAGSPSPRGKLKSRSPKGKPRSPMRCVCEVSRKPTQTLSLSRSRTPSELDDADSTSPEEDTDVEDVEDRRPPARQRLPCPDNSESGRRKVQKSDSNKSSTKTTRKKSPYIEEYPPDEKRRPVILLKEHKLPRRFSGSDTKQHAQASEDCQGVTSAPRGRSPPRKGLSAWTAHPEAQLPRRVGPGASPKKHRSEIPCAPGGSFSDLDQGSSEPESLPKKPAKALKTSPPRRRRSHGTQGVSEMTSSPKQRPAWPRQLQYSSSWPLQTGPSHPYRPGQDQAYDSDEESDHTPYTRPQHVHHDREAGHSERRHDSQGGGRIVSGMDITPRDQEALHLIRRRPSHGDSNCRPRVSNLPAPHREPVSLDLPPHGQDSPRYPQTHHARPPRPIVARTIISQRSMAAMDQGYPRASTATSMCEIWRGHPEDWESPYSSSDDEDGFMPDVDGEPVPFLKHLALEEPPAGYHDSNASYFSGRSRSRSRPSHQHHSEFLHHGPAGAVGFLRRSDGFAGFDEFDGLIRCESPEWTEDGEEGRMVFLDVATTRGGRAVSRARSRWSVMAPRERDLEDPPVRRWMVDGAPSGGRWAVVGKRPRSPSPVFSARKTREFLSPKPRRPARFDFDAWDRERASRSTLALGRSPGFVR